MVKKYRKKVAVNSISDTQIVLISSDDEDDPDQMNTYFEKQNPKKNSSESSKSQHMNPYQLILEIPTVQLTQEQMKGDPLVLITELQQKYRRFGAVKLKACPEWCPPFSFKYSQKPITTRIQKIHKIAKGKVSYGQK